MEIFLTSEATPNAHEILSKSGHVSDISYFVNEDMKSRNYGTSITEIIATLNCYDPNFGSFSKEWKTGTVIHKKYVKFKKLLEFDVKINHTELLNASEDAIHDLIKEALLSSYEEIQDLSISQFNTDKFYKDLEASLINAREKIRSGEHYVHPVEPDKDLIRTPKPSFKPLKEADFWSLIKDSLKIAKRNHNQQLESIINLLSFQSDERIIGFEITLRELIKKAYHVNILASAKVVDGYVTDDSFLYFRAKLILFGKDTFYQALNDPNNLSGILNPDPNGDELLSAADQAYQKKKGGDYFGELPSDIAIEFIDYDDLSEDPDGMMWKESEFNKRYAGLINLFKPKI